METKAWSLFDFGDGKKDPSVLSASELDMTPAQTVADDVINSEPAKAKVDRSIDYEVESEREAYTNTYVNNDGTKTVKYSSTQRNYKDDGQWHRIDNSLEAVQIAKPKTLLDIAAGTEPMEVKSDEYVGRAGIIKTTMGPLRDGLSLDFESNSLKLTPSGANDVDPVKRDARTVVYKDAWPGVDIEYELRGEVVKEVIVINEKTSKHEFDFNVEGGKIMKHPTRKGELAIEGIHPEKYSFSSLTLDVYGRGVISEERVSQEPTDNGIKVKLDGEWLKDQPESAFPIRIDPSFYRYNDVGDMYKSDGYSCNQTNCHFNTGAINDNGWKYWRTYFQFNYSNLSGGKKVLAATVQMPMVSGIGGDTGNRNMWLGYAHCSGFHCVGGTPIAHAPSVGTWANINFTDALQARVNANDFNAKFGIWGEEGTIHTYKPFYEMHIDVVYDTPTPQTSAIEPVNKQVTVSTQPTLRVQPVTDADGESTEYYYRVSTASDAESGAVINSGWITGTQWTIPEGILQDGTTYYWHVYTRGTSTTGTTTVPNWVRSFKVDLRTGKDSTQEYDEIGSIGVDLATGNVTTSASTHSINALGGSIGLTMNYNTPTNAKHGLKGEYWNVAQNYNFSSGVPTGTPNLIRNDQDINFNWKTDSPGPGVNSDWFYVRWKGFFEVPSTGNYQFGTYRDDYSKIVIDGQNVTGGCYGWTPCYGSSIALQAGDVVPVDIQYQEGGGDANVAFYVKGAVDEQILPRDWLRTEPVASASQYGLTGRYYTHTGANPAFPTNSNDPSRLMMVRTDSKLSFNWGSAGPASGLQADNFMTKWTGYITVPTTGSYTFGATTDDGVRIKLNNGFMGAEQTVLDSWQDQAATVWGSATSLTSGQQVPITVEYYEHGGGAQFTLRVKDTNNIEQEIPVKWLTPKATALPDAWRLGLDVDGNVSYERLRVAGSNVILEDSTRATHEYIWTGSGFKPPENEDGNLVRNADNTYTLIDTDGRTYIFDAEGKLTSLTAPVDDRSPSGLKYEYSGDPARLTKIVDGVTNNRYGTLHYKSVNEDGNCSVPSGFDAAPDGMLCAFKTTDDAITKLYYKAGQLSRIERPGSELVDFGYDSLGRLSSTRDEVANDAVSASVRADDATATTEVTYDELGRASTVKAPSALAGGNRPERSYDYVGNIKKIMSMPSVGQPVAGTTVAVSWGGTRIDIFARGTGNDLLHSWSDDGVNWYAWESLGGCIREKPAVASWAKGRLDIFAQGCNDTGNNLYHKWFGSQWSNWELGPALPGITRFQGSPSAVSWSEARLDYVVRGTDNKLYHGWYSSGWGTPQTWTSCLSTSPTISSPGRGDLDIYTVGCESSADKVVSKKTYRLNSGGWSALSATSLNAVAVQASSISYDANILSYKKADQIGYIRFADGTEKLADCMSGVSSVISTTNAVYSFHTPCGSTNTIQSKINLGGASELHVTGAQEPNGFSSRIEYDELLRTIKETDVANLSRLTEWDSVKDLQLSTTEPTGLKSTTIYDDDDRPVEAYGPAPTSWYGVDRKPLSAHLAQVPKTTSSYDEGMNGLAVAYLEATSDSNVSLIGAPQLHTTNIATDGTVSKSFGATSPIPGSSSAWGMTMTGKMRLPTTGNWSFRIFSDNGVRVWIDDSLVLDSWSNGGQRSHSSITYSNTVANSLHRIRVDYYHALGGADAVFNLYATPPGGSETANTAQYFTPNYSLTTTETTYDSQIGNVSKATEYTSPEYGIIGSATADPTGLSLEASSIFEAPGTGFLRQTSKTLPGGNTTIYQHYGATDTRDNPCTTETEAIHQGGMPKGRTDADPDGSGSQSARSSETVYNEAGAIVAIRYNSDPWTCIEYDARGRMLTTIIPTVGSNPGRTITYNYAVDSNPLKTSVSDNNGTITTVVDLFGRIVSYTDANSKTTTSVYDDFGKLSSRSGPLGTESFVYDNTDKVVEQKLDNTTIAAPYYDQFGRLTSVDYPTAGLQELSSITRDDNGRTIGYSYTLGDSTIASDSITRSQSGQVLTNTRVVGSNSLNSSFSYDKVGRLINATVGSDTYAYEFGAIDTSCGSGDNINPNAGKNSNRTKQIINSVTTTYCYDYADRLVSSSDQLVNAPEYDAHGNTTKIGSTSTPLSLQYDASDRNTGLEELDSNQTGKGVYYKRDALDRIIERNADTITTGTHQTDSLTRYGFTKDSDAPDVLLDSNGDVKEKYLSLIGGVLLTLRPDETIDAQKATYSLPNIHGDIFVTTDKNGTLIGNFDYDPFGNKIGSGNEPENTASGSFDWVGGSRKQTENDFALNITQMGARVYIPTLGRFLQADPVEGGALNNYVYVVDPINQYDLNGKFAFIPVAFVLARIVMAIVVAAAPVVAVKTLINTVKKGAAKQAGTQVIKATSTQTGKGSSRAASSAKPSAPPSPKQAVLPNMAASRQKTQVHGNSLQSQRATWGYKLYSNDGAFLKNGITSSKVAERRYTKSFMQDKYMEKTLFSNRLDAYNWEYAQNLLLRGPLNHNMH